MHNWRLYDVKCKAAQLEGLRGRTPVESLALYEDLYRFSTTRPASLAGRQRVEMLRWREKVAIRRKVTDAFAKLDRLSRE